MNEADYITVTNRITQLEQDSEYATLSKNRVEEKDSRVDIIVRSYRRRNCDPDGMSVKAALDGIVDAGILSDDSSQQIKSITFENIKIESKETEQTLIIITEGELI